MAKSKSAVPQAKDALDKFKMEAAKDVGVNLKSGYNGDLSAKDAGSVGGQMVNNVCPLRRYKFTREYRTKAGHSVTYTYETRITI